MGPTCVWEGFSLISYISKSDTNVELMNISKSGVGYPDTSFNLWITKVQVRALMNFEFLSPSWYHYGIFGDGFGATVFLEMAL